ncbi:carbohydrate porin (plasmid) [Polymorphobacter sp. PAMC 29334]|uniref:carbohydrate porin n=1 Tax=Polymorphobacter sp. PAMC 29334 TaxID=2862331 RepID=UPI001C6651AE|nr:carbohydrate porin [Polymorphobacter sp. PAMC 29334]QYE33321.1 carbohydrate porin [Polymorphobacter sp. PAMC 29334]
MSKTHISDLVAETLHLSGELDAGRPKRVTTRFAAAIPAIVRSRLVPRSAWHLQIRCCRAVLATYLVVAAPVVQAQTDQDAPLENPQYRGENGSNHRKPIDVTFNYSSDLNADVAGGESRGLVYLGRASVLFDADLDHLIGLPGATAHLSFSNIHGIGLSGRHVSNLLLVSGLEAEPATRLNQLWFQIAPTSTTTLRVGKFTAAQEFMVTETGNLFVNSTFGWPAGFATDLPSGGPSYPISDAGVRLAAKPDDHTTLRIAVFAGDPAGPGGGDPQQREKQGFNTFGLSGRPFIIGQISRDTGGTMPALTATLGGWVHFDRFAVVSNPSVAPGPVLPPFGRGANYAVYGLIDGQLWQSTTDEKRLVSGFFRLSCSPSDRNVVDLYADAGITLSDPFAGRDSDKLGLGVGIARISPRLRSAAQTLLESSTSATYPAALEAVIELSYQAALIGKLQVQPNLQFVIHPASEALSIQNPGGRSPNALVLGLRASASF